METNIKSLWARIILTSYRNIERVIESIDRTIDCVSMQGISSRNSYTSTEVLINKIIELIYRKEGLINLKIISQEVIRNMRLDYINLLELKFLKNKKFQDIADELGISLRTVFRYYDKALHQFTCLLNLKGFNAERLEIEYDNDPYIDKIKAKIVEDYRSMDEVVEKRKKNQIIRVLDNINLLYKEEAITY